MGGVGGYTFPGETHNSTQGRSQAIFTAPLHFALNVGPIYRYVKLNCQNACSFASPADPDQLFGRSECRCTDSYAAEGVPRHSRPLQGTH